MSRYCPKCGKPVPATAKFCRHCGQKLNILSEKTDLSENDAAENLNQSNAIKKSLIAFVCTLLLIGAGYMISRVIRQKNMISDIGTADHTTVNDMSETQNEKPGNSAQIELSGFLGDISLFADYTGAQRIESSMFDFLYETDDGLSAMASEENGPVTLLWVENDKYALYGISLYMNSEEAVNTLKNQGWKYLPDLKIYEKDDYVISLVSGSDSETADQKVTEITYGLFSYYYGDFMDSSETYDKPIGNLIVNVDKLRKRRGPSLSADFEGSVVNTGDYFEVYETAYYDGYTWYRIGTDIWIASDGTYVTYQQY